jgi:hypothetical protein
MVIRAHKRFAVCQKARLRRPGKRAEEGLLIELSLEGCRISRLTPDTFALDQQVTLRIEGAKPLEGRIRWLGDSLTGGTVGLRFVRPLHAAALDQLIRLCRGQVAAPQIAAPQIAGGPLRAYGT